MNPYTTPKTQAITPLSKEEFRELVINGNHPDAGPLFIMMYRNPVMFWMVIIAVFLVPVGFVWFLLAA